MRPENASEDGEVSARLFRVISRLFGNRTTIRILKPIYKMLEVASSRRRQNACDDRTPMFKDSTGTQACTHSRQAVLCAPFHPNLGKSL